MIDLFAPIAGPMKQYRMTSARAAEAVKAFENEFIAWADGFRQVFSGR